MLVDAGFLRLVADVDLKEHALHRNVFGQAAGQRFGELQVVHSVDEGETPGDVLGLVGLDVADAMPLHIEIGKGLLLGKRFLHRDAGGPGEAPAHGFEAFPKRCCF